MGVIVNVVNNLSEIHIKQSLYSHCSTAKYKMPTDKQMKVCPISIE